MARLYEVVVRMAIGMEMEMEIGFVIIFSHVGRRVLGKGDEVIHES